MATVFFSYSHNDEGLRNELEKHLSSLKREGLVQTWHDRRIVAGDDFDASIDGHIEDADIVLLLVSADFIASDYCYTREMNRALERHARGGARVIPVILRQCDWQNTPIGKLLATPPDGRPVTRFTDLDEGFTAVAKDIRRALMEMGASADVHLLLKTGTQIAADAVSSPRSSNLRVPRKFSDAEKDRFRDETFEFIARFFQNSLDELQLRYGDIETNFNRVDSRHFVCSIYRDGKRRTQCTISVGGRNTFGDIRYAEGESLTDNTCNDSYTVGDDGDSLGLMGMGFGMYHAQRDDALLTPEGAAERMWDILLRPLKHR